MIKKNKKYKALILDIDGTIVLNNEFSLPSQNIINAVKLAQKKISVIIATARRYQGALNIINTLGLTDLAIISGGAEIRKCDTGKILWSRNIPENTSKKIIQMFAKENFDIWIDDNNYYHLNRRYNKNHPPEDTLQISIVDVPLKISDIYVKKLSIFPEINVHKALSWDNRDAVWLSITHNEASKQHGIFEVAKILGIETHEIIGVGDGYNDFPLLMACGLRVAMGNAVPELKAIADYIAPTVEDDGVADVIEKFIL